MSKLPWMNEITIKRIRKAGKYTCFSVYFRTVPDWKKKKLINMSLLQTWMLSNVSGFSFVGAVTSAETHYKVIIQLLDENACCILLENAEDVETFKKAFS